VRVVHRTEPGVIELNWMWLPTWIGMNQQLTRELNEELSRHIVGRPLTDETLDDISEIIVNYLEDRYPHLEGLRDYLDGLKFVAA
jgi:hypothetical protein